MSFRPEELDCIRDIEKAYYACPDEELLDRQLHSPSKINRMFYNIYVYAFLVFLAIIRTFFTVLGMIIYHPYCAYYNIFHSGTPFEIDFVDSQGNKETTTYPTLQYVYMKSVQMSIKFNDFIHNFFLKISGGTLNIKMINRIYR